MSIAAQDEMLLFVASKGQRRAARHAGNAARLCVTKNGLQAIARRLRRMDTEPPKKGAAMQDKSPPILLRIIFLSLFLGMTGCAVMDKSECSHADWHGLGKKDALKGEDGFSAREKSCRKHGLGADKTSYERGFQEGLAGFCTAASGRHHGQGGGTYQRGFCPAHTESDFLSGYTPAQQKYKFQQKINALQAKIAANDDLLREESRRTPKNSSEIDRLGAETKRLKEELRMQMYLRVLD